MKALTFIALLLSAASALALPVSDADNVAPASDGVIHFNMSTFHSRSTLEDGAYTVTYDSAGLPLGVKYHRHSIPSGIDYHRRSAPFPFISDSNITASDNSTAAPDNSTAGPNQLSNVYGCGTPYDQGGPYIALNPPDVDAATRALEDKCGNGKWETVFMIKGKVVAYFCMWEHRGNCRAEGARWAWPEITNYCGRYISGSVSDAYEHYRRWSYGYTDWTLNTFCNVWWPDVTVLG
ncbi:hypothetical protein B0T16DRAFT_247884 [Cercophora newfieldiana]|uniref:Uncharacterized protein n=1 Tax=Cercophora newfieldiana TaxID=92897 RepID=A0AA39XT47_9PEZI|nr:hypothetical protein B0T16DRAFT_247884 [Cercophora newfieldiana]